MVLNSIFMYITHNAQKNVGSKTVRIMYSYDVISLEIKNARTASRDETPFLLTNLKMHRTCHGSGCHRPPVGSRLKAPDGDLGVEVPRSHSISLFLGPNVSLVHGHCMERTATIGKRKFLTILNHPILPHPQKKILPRFTLISRMTLGAEKNEIR